MGSSENRLRRKWQDIAGSDALKAETTFYHVFETLFVDTEYRILRHPNKFKKLYLDVKLSKQELSEIYVPDKVIREHGIYPDCIIRNTRTGKEIYVEIKKQDGWVENKSRTDGRGNAHERLCKYFTPGLLKYLRKQSGIKSPALPLWAVFQGDITRDICRVREIRFWFDNKQNHLTFWRDTTNATPVVEHFLNHIMPLLD